MIVLLERSYCQLVIGYAINMFKTKVLGDSLGLSLILTCRCKQVKETILEYLKMFEIELCQDNTAFTRWRTFIKASFDN